MDTANNNVQQRQPLWSDENIMNDARRATSNPTAQAQIRNCLLIMRHGYEADRQQLTARIQELERELAEARSQRWEPVAGMPQPDSPQGHRRTNDAPQMG